MCRFFGESESECIRESSVKCGGQEKAGLPADRKRKWCKVVKWFGESSQLSWVCGVGRGVLPCVISGRGTVFFYYRQRLVHKGLRHYLPSPLPPILLCARALARLARTKLSRLLYKESYIFLLVRCLLVFYSVIKRVKS